MSVTIRVSTALRDTLKALADQQGVAMQTVVEEAVRTYQDVLRLKALNESLARLSPQEHQDLKQELDYWEGATLKDGFGPEDVNY